MTLVKKRVESRRQRRARRENPISALQKRRLAGLGGLSDPTANTPSFPAGEVIQSQVMAFDIGDGPTQLVAYYVRRPDGRIGLAFSSPEDQALYERVRAKFSSGESS